MGLETATSIAALNSLWPLGTDPRSQGDDHLRLLKRVMQADVVPASGGAFSGGVAFNAGLTVKAGAFAQDADGEKSLRFRTAGALEEGRVQWTPSAPGVGLQARASPGGAVSNEFVVSTTRTTSALGIASSQGYLTKTGKDGSISPGGNMFNLSWSSPSVSLWIDTSNRGTINTTASDERLKENIADWSGDALATVRALQPRVFSWRETKSAAADCMGFIAQEVAAAFPYGAVGAPDAVDENGGVSPMGVNEKALIALLAGAVDALAERLEAVEARG